MALEITFWMDIACLYAFLNEQPLVPSIMESMSYVITELKYADPITFDNLQKISRILENVTAIITLTKRI